MSNQAAWIPSKGAAIEIGHAEMPIPGPGELVIENHAIPLHPGDWKLAKGIIPIPMTYPAILGNYTAGTIHSLGPNTTRFKVGERVLSMSALALRNDHRFGGHQKYTLSTEMLTAHIGPDVGFEEASAASIVYAAMSALVLHLNLARPPLPPSPRDPISRSAEKVLIWGGGSSLGFFAVQIAALAGYTVLSTASPASFEALKQVGAKEVLDYRSPSIAEEVIALGPFKTVFAAADAAGDQVVIGQVLAAQGGGRFISTMGVRPGVVLPPGVEGVFVQYMDDYLKPENEEFVKWVWGDAGFLEWGLREGGLALGEVEGIGGLGMLAEGLRRLEKGEARGRRLVVRPGLE
ncbi:GroES-like protein [Hyaloscypha bicolor E]|uniref:GroES-like protein n=1 Tax=Hyaloscypha bicolor E TaxID=1095630 RepID=A0A2J6SPP8_9HELO|nr:GroES-like protein [Hyaloscypha bicolor E]PMD52739.1 GroES-like protein [Hyaloscypha bicolor E]